MVKKRKYSKRETRLVAEWLAKFYPTALQWKRVRLGPLPDRPDAKIYFALRRWADIVFFHDDTVHIVEAKMRADPGAISQLKLYGELFPETPEFSAYKNKPVKLILLSGIEDVFLRRLAAKEGVEYVVYSPKWAKEWWDQVIARGT